MDDDAEQVLFQNVHISSLGKYPWYAGLGHLSVGTGRTIRFRDARLPGMAIGRTAWQQPLADMAGDNRCRFCKDEKYLSSVTPGYLLF